MKDKNDLAFWYPILQATGVATPRTEIVETNCKLIQLLDGKPPDGWAEFLHQLANAADRSGFPCFLRTGHTSGKHQWDKTCFVADETSIPNHVAELVEFSECASFFGMPTDTWVVREFLKLDSSFTAFRGMPVNRERRYFIENGRVLCSHPYWPVESIEQHAESVQFVEQCGKIPNNPLPANWREQLSALNDRTNDPPWLDRESARISEKFEGAWSLDWARTADGRWVAIDMATADRSFHWAACHVAIARSWNK